MRREYGLGAAALWALSVREFVVYLAGLSAEALFREAYKRTPRRVSSPAEIQAITGVPVG